MRHWFLQFLNWWGAREPRRSYLNVLEATVVSYEKGRTVAGDATERTVEGHAVERTVREVI